MKVNSMNAKIVASSSEAMLFDALHGQPPALVARLTRILRIRQALRWTGPEISQAPSIVHRTDPDGTKHVELTDDLIAEGRIWWDPREMSFVSHPDDPATYSIPSEDDELPEVLDYPDVPEAVRDRLQEHLEQLQLEPSGKGREPFVMPEHEVPSLGPGIQMGSSGTFAVGIAEALAGPTLLYVLPWQAWEAADDSRVVRLLHAADGHEIGRVHHREGDDRCTIELTPPFPGRGEPSEIILMVEGQTIEPVIPFDKYGCGCVRYGDIEKVIDGKSGLYFTSG